MPKGEYKQIIYDDWCKSCGICVAFCPKKVIEKDAKGNPCIVNQDKCSGCTICELHCPDFAINVEELSDDE